MLQKTLKITAFALASGSVASLVLSSTAMAGGGAGTTPGGDNEIHAAGVSLTVPATLGPTGGDSHSIDLIAPGPITPSPASLPAINPNSLPPDAATSAAANSRPEVQFYSPDDTLDVPTKFGTLHVLPGSLVLAISAEDALSVYDLHDGNANAVYVMADNQKFPLGPGKHITLAHPHCTNFAAVNKLPFVAYYSADFEQLSNGMVCFHGKYDLNSLIFRFAPFKALLNSKEQKTRRVAEKVVKNAVIMNQLAANAKYYQLKPSAPQAGTTK